MKYRTSSDVRFYCKFLLQNPAKNVIRIANNIFLGYVNIIFSGENILKKNILNIFLDNLYSFPLWVKQVIFVKLKRDLEKHNFNTICENSFSMYSPTLTFNGENELRERGCGFDNNIYNFLKACENDCSMLDIALNNFWSMEESAKYFEFCSEQGFITKPESKEISAMSGFIAGKYRIGEYFLHKGSIVQTQLEQTVETAKHSDKKFAQILADLGFISYNDAISALMLKEEAQTRFVLDYNNTPKCECAISEAQKEQKEIENLRLENAKLQKKLTQLLGLVKNDSRNFD